MATREHWPRLRESPTWQHRSIEDRARAIELACRAAMQLLDKSPERKKRLSHVDELPASSKALLRRLSARRDA